MKRRIDLVTFEVLRHRLWEINDEMGILAARISGSPAVYESNDFNCAILTADGKGLFTGIYVIRQASALDVLIQSVIERFGSNIADGDMFMTNDPWCGALHAMDYAVVAPVCWQGEIVAWTGVVMHELDVGGPRPGSWTVGARDSYQECPLMPPVKIVEGGRLRRDIESVFLRNSRTADINALNLRSKIAAQLSARERILDIVREYGKDTFLAVQDQIMEFVRTSVKKRIASIPDGVWYGNTFLDHDGVDNKLYRLRLALKKKGDRLCFDFTGTSKQAPGPINCAYSGLIGGITQVLFPLLCFDVPWSHGAVMDCIDIISEEGTINNATFPAATSMATVNGCTATGNLIFEAMGRMYSCCEELRDEVMGLSYGGVNLGVLSGQNNGRRFLNLFTDSVGGGGAKFDRDGVNTSGSMMSPGYSIPNVERIESLIPVLYLYRKERNETSGPGINRGGVGLEFMMIPHLIESDMNAVFFSTGCSHLITKGLGGGMPGSIQQNALLRNADVRAYLDSGRIPVGTTDVTCDKFEIQEAKAATTISPTDAWLNFCCGGGGIGDPLERDPERVAYDVKLGLCAAEEANRHYGVALQDDGSVSDSQTRQRREELKATRFKRGIRLGSDWQGTVFEGPQLLPYGESLAIRKTKAGPAIGCTRCKHCFGPAHEDPRQRALMVEFELSELSALNPKGPSDVVVRLYCCPSCGTSFSSDVQLRTEDPRMPEMHLGQLSLNIDVKEEGQITEAVG